MSPSLVKHTHAAPMQLLQRYLIAPRSKGCRFLPYVALQERGEIEPNGNELTRKGFFESHFFWGGCWIGGGGPHKT